MEISRLAGEKVPTGLTCCALGIATTKHSVLLVNPQCVVLEAAINSEYLLDLNKYLSALFDNGLP